MTYVIDLSIGDDSEERAIVVYQYMTQRMHRLFQPVPQEVLTRKMVERHREDGYERMMHNYFGPNCTWGPIKFHQRLGMYRPLFLRIISEIVVADPTFDFQVDCTGKLGHSPHMKMYAVMKCLCKGIAADSTDDYVRMGAPIVYMYVKRFTRVIVLHFGSRYMRLPTREDTERLLAENMARGFPGLLGSVDWSNNDLNVLAQSPLFDKMVNGLAAPCNYRINVHSYNKGYYLADNIYPRLSCIVQLFKILLPNQHVTGIPRSYNELRNDEAYLELRNDLVQHIWTRHGLGLIDGEMLPESPPPPPDGSDGEFDPTDVYPPQQQL
ncbi:uncharacterized protein LOC113295660 [Papaver somniferum]|uniref:uncharacterized protein LOC113295660 n=1 Tax=Papaver somniferum TaxID=3469 RepID=UPI000E6FEE7B|nr:uncharacterized protein LOC113295660 [Papaver somniferum]